MARRRWNIQVGIDINKPEHWEVGAQVEKWTQAREWTRMFVKAITLLMTLERGETDFLYENYPWLRNAQAAEPTAAAQPSLPQPKNAQLRVSKRQADENDLRQVIDNLDSSFGDFM